MTLVLRIVLLVASLLASLSMIRQIRSARLKSSQAIFWVLLCLLVVVLAVFPQVAYAGARLVGVQTTVIFVFLVIIALLIFKLFRMTIQMANLESRLDSLAENIAIEEFERHGKAPRAARPNDGLMDDDDEDGGDAS